ncbi:uncharacterized protein LAESUDRAFT_811011 [Laetiporus sulphureus 93-53]|uniref:Uncharacterized protein n=1 Tax=Laetiporus sulphureus 93-53 TaxID=1314785 RepID=A0A165FFC1_9APHY|nr:uncharacterized protein LAESUDRAFT_811011 [Laetiporus sulphureus 93-53]KZT08884.1 hypothetical protein LAESUDRAFT_811011 [Laetiporus sulphureus 93-53]
MPVASAQEVDRFLDGVLAYVRSLESASASYASLTSYPPSLPIPLRRHIPLNSQPLQSIQNIQLANREGSTATNGVQPTDVLSTTVQQTRHTSRPRASHDNNLNDHGPRLQGMTRAALEAKARNTARRFVLLGSVAAASGVRVDPPTLSGFSPVNVIPPLEEDSLREHGYATYGGPHARPPVTIDDCYSSIIPPWRTMQGPYVTTYQGRPLEAMSGARRSPVGTIITIPPFPDVPQASSGEQEIGGGKPLVDRIGAALPSALRSPRKHQRKGFKKDSSPSKPKSARRVHFNVDGEQPMSSPGRPSSSKRYPQEHYPKRKDANDSPSHRGQRQRDRRPGYMVSRDKRHPNVRNDEVPHHHQSFPSNGHADYDKTPGDYEGSSSSQQSWPSTSTQEYSYHEQLYSYESYSSRSSDGYPCNDS